MPDSPPSLTVPLVRQSLSPRIFPASPPSHTALLSPRTIPAASPLQTPLSARMILTPPPSLLALLSLGTIPASTHTPAKLLKPRNDSSLPRPSPQAPISPGTIPTSHLPPPLTSPSARNDTHLCHLSTHQPSLATLSHSFLLYAILPRRRRRRHPPSFKPSSNGTCPLTLDRTAFF